MDFEYSDTVANFSARIEAFLAEHIYPSEERSYREVENLLSWNVYPVVEELKEVARGRDISITACA